MRLLVIFKASYAQSLPMNNRRSKEPLRTGVNSDVARGLEEARSWLDQALAHVRQTCRYPYVHAHRVCTITKKHEC